MATIKFSDVSRVFERDGKDFLILDNINLTVQLTTVTYQCYSLWQLLSAAYNCNPLAEMQKELRSENNKTDTHIPRKQLHE